MSDRMLGIKKDDLTNCYLKNGIYPLLQMLIDEYPTSQKPFSLLFMDLDFFKHYNDTYGHLVGDEILKYFSSSIRLDLYGLENIPFRFGGDEFVIVFPGRLPIEVYPLVMRLRDNIRSRACIIKGTQIKLTFSGGIASYPADGKTIEELMESADKAVYVSKKKGRNRVTIFNKIWSADKKRNLLIAAAAAGVLVLGLPVIFISDILRWTRSEEAQRYRTQAVETFTRAKKKALDTMHGVTRPGVTGNAIPVSLEDETAPVPAPAVTPAPVPAPVQAAEPPVKRIYLRTGGVIKGVIVVETDEEVRIRLKVGEGEGTMTIRKSNIVKIE